MIIFVDLSQSLRWGRVVEVWFKVVVLGMVRRVEAGMMNYGSDMTIENNPFQLMGLERLVEEQPQDYIGKDALERIRKQGVSRKLVGIEFDAGPFDIDPSDFWPASSKGEAAGRVT